MFNDEKKDMPSGKNFTRFITISLVIYISFALIIIIGFVYTWMGRIITNDYNLLIQAQQAEIGMLLHERHDYYRKKLIKIGSNDSLKNLIIKENSKALYRLIDADSNDKAAFLTVYDNENQTFIPALSSEYEILKNQMIETAHLKISGTGFSSGISIKKLPIIMHMPISDKNGHYGTVFLLYNMARDTRLWQRFGNYNSLKILFKSDEGMVDIKTGNLIPEMSSVPSGLSGEKDTLSAKGEILLSIKKHPGYYLLFSTESIDQKKKNLLTYMSLLGVMIFISSVFLSFYISRKVKKPLDKMVSEAIKIAAQPEDHLLDEESIEYSEFRKLARSFNEVLVSFFNARDELEKKAEEEIPETNTLYRLTVEAAPDSILVTDLKTGEFLHVNETFEKMTGYRSEEILGKTSIDINLYKNPDDRTRMIGQIWEQGEVNNLELEFRVKNGSIRYVIFSARKIVIKGKERLVSVFTDITDRKKIEDSIAQSKENLQVILSAIPFGVVIVGKDKIIRNVNASALKILGYKNENELTGLKCHSIMCPAEEGHCPILDLNETIDRSERFVVVKGGNKIPVLKSAISLKIDDEEMLLETFIDITELKKAEDDKKKLEIQLQRATKMEAIGTLAGGVAHDLNNILAGLVSYPELLLMEIPEESHLRKPILTIQKSGEKAAAIVQDLLTLARRGVSTREIVNLNSVIEEYLKSPEYQKLISFHSEVRVKISLGSGILNIMGSPVHLSKTIMNLISNAAEAMPAGGEITVSTYNRYIDNAVNGDDKDFVILEVADTGIGMSPKDRERVFEPFYTKKKMGKSGTGLGMAVVWGTVKDHEGYIDIESEEGRGTTFKLSFPATHQDLLVDENYFDVNIYKGKGEKILVVDDVEEQRIIAEGFLSRLNYSVKSVPSGEAAIKYLMDNSVDLIVLDMIMTSGMDGLETYRRILDIYPHQKAIIASGYSEDKRVKEAQKLGAGEYIKKPYLLENICKAVRNELDRLTD